MNDWRDVTLRWIITGDAVLSLGLKDFANAINAEVSYFGGGSDAFTAHLRAICCGALRLNGVAV